MYKFPHTPNTSVRSLSQIKIKERNKLFFKKAKNEITFKPIARQKEIEAGKETEKRTREY